MEYGKETAEKIKEIASRSMDVTQAKIDDVNKLESHASSTAREYLFGWQSWLGNISFALSAIVGAVLVGKDEPKPNMLLSLLLLLSVGLWISLLHKRTFENATINASRDADKFNPSLNDKKKAAFDLWENPTSINKHIYFLERELKITRLGKRLEKELLKQIEDSKISYLNDIWLAMMVSAIYLLMYQIGEKAYSSLNWKHLSYVLVFMIVWVILIAIIMFEALRSRDSISSSNETKISKIRSQLNHSAGYEKRVKEEIQTLREVLKSGARHAKHTPTSEVN